MDPAVVLAALDRANALVVGLLDDDGEPYPTRGWALVAHAQGSGVRARVLVAADDAPPVGAGGGRRVAVTATDVATLRSVQAKGAVVAVEAATTDDLRAAEVYTAAFFAAVQAIDNVSGELMARMLPDRYAAVVFDVDEGFDQTPGPSAGKPWSS